PEPLVSPSGGASNTPDVEPDDVTTTPEDPAHDPGTSAPPPRRTGGSDGASKGTAGTTEPGSGDPQHKDEAKNWYRKVVSACRDYRSGELQGEKRRRLEEAAKGPQRVTEFCGRVLDGSGSDREHNGGCGNGNGGGDDDGDKGGDDGNGDGSSGGGNDHWGNGGSSPVPPIVAPSHPHNPHPAPTPTVSVSYSAQPVLPGS
ncbi:MAG: hypothetical protein WCD21_15420, partial [Streptomyces sp.]